ncbi:MAG: flagellar FlbD family protein [Phycisphaeraceae bacterium]|nr:flagellar FlbD family protein [Phycisphaeraceae bacterium]
MITLTRLNGDRFVVNAEAIRYIEERPDTTLTMVGGDRVIVSETMREVVERSIDYGRHLRKLMPPS